VIQRGSTKPWGGEGISDDVRDAVKLEIPWGSTSMKQFRRVFINASHLHLPQYEAQKRIIKKQRTGRLRRWENVNPNPMWNHEIGDGGKGMVETKREEDTDKSIWISPLRGLHNKNHHQPQPAVDTRGGENLEIDAGCHSRRRHLDDFGIGQALQSCEKDAVR
jgi:hypothetical protein